jgi:hypothetical protein
MEDRGITTDRGEDHRQIQAENEKRALRKGKRKDYAGAPEASPMPDAQSEAEKIAGEAIRKEEERQEQAGKTEEERQEQARKDQDKLQNDLIAADKKLKELGQIYREAQELRERLIKQARELDAANDRFEQQQEKRQRELERQQNPYLDYAKEKEVQIEDRRQEIIGRRDRQYLEGDIRDAGTRHSQALHHNYDFGDPYLSLAKVAIAEYASFRGEQNALSAEIAKTADPKLREALEIRRKIEGYEYLMLTGERIAVQSELITGRKNSEEATSMRERINGGIVKDENGKQIAFPGYAQEVQNLRFRYRELQAERAAPAKEQGEPQTALDKIVADSKNKKPEPPGPDKQPERSATALDTIVEDAKHIAEGRQLLDGITEAKRQRLKGSRADPDPQVKKDRLQQQERERKAQKDRERER